MGYFLKSCHLFHNVTFAFISVACKFPQTFEEVLPCKEKNNEELVALSSTLGFGAFVDKTVLPYTNTNEKKLSKPCDEDDQQCQAAFGYKHVLSMTSSQDDFREKVTEQAISGNLDSPEGSLDAMMQAAVCGVSTQPKRQCTVSNPTTK